MRPLISTRAARAATLALLVACGDDGAEPAEAPTPATRETAVDLAGGHKDGPLGTHRSTFFGLRRGHNTIHFTDGRSLQEYERRNPAASSPDGQAMIQVGDAWFHEAEWYFDGDDRLRKLRAWDARMAPGACALAAAGLVDAFGAPDTDKGGEKTWTGAWVHVRWRDTAQAGAAGAAGGRCVVEWVDLRFFRAG